MSTASDFPGSDAIPCPEAGALAAGGTPVTAAPTSLPSGDADPGLNASDASGSRGASREPPVVMLEGEEAERLVERHQAGIWRYLRAMGCDANEADDLTQDTFVLVLRRPFTNHGDVATSAYLRRVALNRLISVRRKSGREHLVGELQELDIVWDRLAGSDQGEAMLEALQLCLKSLADRSRRALDMRYRQGVPRAMIAESLQITEHGVKNLMQRAKEKLRKCIERRIS